MPERRRDDELIFGGLALLGFGGLLLLHNHGAPKPVPPPVPLPPPPTPAPVIPPVIVPGPTGGVPVPRPPTASAPVQALKVPVYLVKNLNGSVRLRTTSKAQAIAAALQAKVAGLTVWTDRGQLVYIVPGLVAARTYVYVPPVVSVYAGRPTISKSGRSL